MLDTAPTFDGRIMVDGEMAEWHGVQIRVRSARHVTGWTRVNAIARGIDVDVYRGTVTMEEVGAGTADVVYEVQSISRVSGPITLGKNVPSTKRSLFTINANVSVRQAD